MKQAARKTGASKRTLTHNADGWTQVNITAWYPFRTVIGGVLGNTGREMNYARSQVYARHWGRKG